MSHLNADAINEAAKDKIRLTLSVANIVEGDSLIPTDLSPHEWHLVEIGIAAGVMAVVDAFKTTIGSTS